MKKIIFEVILLIASAVFIAYNFEIIYDISIYLYVALGLMLFSNYYVVKYFGYNKAIYITLLSIIYSVVVLPNYFMCVLAILIFQVLVFFQRKVNLLYLSIPITTYPIIFYGIYEIDYKFFALICFYTVFIFIYNFYNKYKKTRFYLNDNY